jgi:protoheme IX farnesyltransferase
VFLWTPPHFWALSLTRADEYARAGVPMLPVVAGRSTTTKHIIAYSLLVLPVSLLPWACGFAGGIYGAVATVCGTVFVALAAQLYRSRGVSRRAAYRLFAFSILYLGLLFAAMLASNANRPKVALSAHADAFGLSQSAFSVVHLQITLGPSVAMAGEV